MEERTRLLRQATQQSGLLVTSVGDGIYGVDATGMVTFVNPAALEVLGWPEADLIGREAHATFHAKREDGTPFPVRVLLRDRGDHRAQGDQRRGGQLPRPDGRPIPVEVTATPLIDDGRAIGAVVVFRDMTQRREVDRMKSEFVSMVSHELRTPVTAIRGALGLSGRRGRWASWARRRQRMVDIALVSSDRLGRLINEILDMERIESGMMSMERAVHPCPAADRVGGRSGAGHRRGRRACASASVPTEGQVYADADRVVQTLLNLLGNAIKFSHPGGYVSVRAEAQGEFVEFAIRDDGRGIPEDAWTRIFSRFHQVDSSDAREKGGSGLGLSISRSIVERLGGRIWASEQRRGGRHLPVHPAGPRADRRATGAAATPTTNGNGVNPLRLRREYF